MYERRRLHNIELNDLNSSPDITKCYSGDQIKKNEVGGVCVMCGRQERAKIGFDGETSGQEDTWK